WPRRRACRPGIAVNAASYPYALQRDTGTVGIRPRLATGLLSDVRELAAPGGSPRPGPAPLPALRTVCCRVGIPPLAMSILRYAGSSLARIFPRRRRRIPLAGG